MSTKRRQSRPEALRARAARATVAEADDKSRRKAFRQRARRRTGNAGRSIRCATYIVLRE